MVLGRVCRGCNNGWMSQLEAAAKPTLLELAAGRVSVSELSPGRRTFARWALKTAAALNVSTVVSHRRGPLRRPSRSVSACGRASR
jgi:hypothetical protein